MFVGRKEYLELLNGSWTDRGGVLVTCRGRRRIGKSTLIEEFAKRFADHFYSIDGLSPRKGMTDEKQRLHFCEKIAEYVGGEVKPAATWSLAFAQLDALIPATGRTVVLLDEVSWMGGYESDFAGYLKEAWDRKLKKHANFTLVVCGSVSAWIAENILDSTGFVGRTTLDIEVGELSLAESLEMLGERARRLSVTEILDLLSLTGGVPRYLEAIRPELSIDENVRQLCFLPHGLLFREFDETFNSVFGQRVSSREKILRKLVNGAKSVSELASEADVSPSGGQTKVLDDLVHAGFVAREKGINPQTGKLLRLERFRVKDNYVRFYLNFVEPRKSAIEAGLFKFSSMEQFPGWETVLGLQFENLVLNHVQDFLPLLGLENVLVLSAAPFTKRSSKTGPGFQIDLLIQTQRSMLVVEIKRRKEISHGIIDEVERKVAGLRKLTKASIRTALVYDGELAKSVPAEGYFDFIIPAGSVFKTPTSRL